MEPKAVRAAVGYCGLIDSGRGGDGEPELAFELLQRVWRQGYAAEASSAVLDRSRSSGYTRLWATVRVWNTASRRVMTKVGFVETGRVEQDDTYGDNLINHEAVVNPYSDAGSARGSGVTSRSPFPLADRGVG